MTERQYAVAIDGPSGAGKSTLARAAAEALHILYVDTGAIYRTIGVYMYRHDIAPTDAPAVIAALPEITVALRYDEEGLQRMYLNGEDVAKTDRYQLRRRIGYVIQQIGLFPNMTVAQNICVVPNLLKYSGSTASSWTDVTSGPWCCRTRR